MNGVKIVYLQAGLTFVRSAPEWKVVIYNDIDKTQFTQSFEQFCADKDNRAPHVVLKSPAVNASYAHCKAIEIAKDPTPAERQQFRGCDALYQVRTKGNDCTFRDYFLLEPYSLPPQVLEFLNAYYGTPNFGCVPLAMEEHFSGSPIRKVFDTLDVKVGAIAKDEFAIPKGLRSVRSRSAVANGSGYKKELDEMAAQMMSTPELTKPVSGKSK